MEIQQLVPRDTQWANRFLEAIWDQLKGQINPFLHVLCISGALYRHMDDGALRFMAEKFMEHTRETVMVCRDGTGMDRYFLGAPRHFLAAGGLIYSPGGWEPFWSMDEGVNIATARVPLPPVPGKPTRIPRPPNAYILYRKERHNIVKEANPGISNNEISQVLGRAWNDESREVRQKYKDLSEQIKKALMEKHPDYQYKPRKSHEKRRRHRKPAEDVSANALDGLAETA